MSIRIFIIFSLFLIISLLGCTGSETVEYEDTVLSKDNTSFLFVQKYVEIEQELSLGQAFEEYGKESVIRFVGLSESKFEGINVGDKVIVHTVGNFDDKEPVTGSAENVEVVE